MGGLAGDCGERCGKREAFVKPGSAATSSAPLRPRCARPPLPEGEAMTSPSRHVPTKGEGFWCGTRRMTIPPSRLCRATSLYTREAFLVRAGLEIVRRGGVSPPVKKAADHRRKPRASEAGKRGRWMGKGNRFLPDERGARSTESAADFAEMGVSGEEHPHLPPTRLLLVRFLAGQENEHRPSPTSLRSDTSPRGRRLFGACRVGKSDRGGVAHMGGAEMPRKKRYAGRAYLFSLLRSVQHRYQFSLLLSVLHRRQSSLRRSVLRGGGGA